MAGFAVAVVAGEDAERAVRRVGVAFDDAAVVGARRVVFAQRDDVPVAVLVDEVAAVRRVVIHVGRVVRAGVLVDLDHDEFIDVAHAPDVLRQGLIASVAGFEDLPLVRVVVVLRRIAGSTFLLVECPPQVPHAYQRRFHRPATASGHESLIGAHRYDFGSFRQLW